MGFGFTNGQTNKKEPTATAIGSRSKISKLLNTIKNEKGNTLTGTLTSSRKGILYVWYNKPDDCPHNTDDDGNATYTHRHLLKKVQLLLNVLLDRVGYRHRVAF